MSRPVGKHFASGYSELGRSRRDSLDVFGQGATQFSTSVTGPIFKEVGGSAWNDALRAAEMLLKKPGSPHIGSPGASRLGRGQDRGKSSEISLDELIGELEAAENNSTESPAEWEGVFQGSQADEHGGKQNVHSGYGRRDRRSSDSGMFSNAAAVPHEVISERAAQWGYGVVLKTSSRDSTPRTSSGSANGGRSSGGGAAAVIPGVSKDVKDALSSFQLAFLVSDATNHDFPILYASAGFTTMTGYTADETVGKNCRFLQGPETDPAEVSRVRDALKEGKIYSGTLLNYKKDGTPFWNLLTISPIKDDAGKVIKYIGMQAEQASKEQQPRNSKGQKSPIMRSQAVPPFLQNMARQEFNEAAAVANRRHSSSSLPRPPVHPQRSSPSPAASSGRRSGSEVLGEQQTRTSQRYSLTSNTERSSRNSSVEHSGQPDWRAAAMNFSAGSSSASPGSKSSFEAPETSASEEKGQKPKSSRLTSRIRRLFKKDKSSRRQDSTSSGKDSYEFSDSGDEKDDPSDYSSHSSRTPRNSSTAYTRSSADNSSRHGGQPSRQEPSINEISDTLGQMERMQDSRGQSPSSLQINAAKRQFCIVHT